VNIFSGKEAMQMIQENAEKRFPFDGFLKDISWYTAGSGMFFKI
jgi:hypothetical protein